MKNQRLAYVYALIAVFLWSTVASAFKISLEYLNPSQLLFYAALCSILTLFSILIYQNKTALIFIHIKNNFLMIVFLAILNPFLFYLVLFKAYDLLPVQEAQTINYTWALNLKLFIYSFIKTKIAFKRFYSRGNLLFWSINYCNKRKSFFSRIYKYSWNNF